MSYWRDGLRAAFSPPRPSGFTYVAESIWLIVPLLLIFGLPPDAIVRHLLVPPRYVAWNLAIDALAIVSTLWICGLVGSMARIPHVVDDEKVRLHLGAFAHIETTPSNVASATALRNAGRRALRRDRKNGAFVALSGSGVVRIGFVRSVKAHRYPFLRPRLVKTALVSSDRPDELVAALEAARDRYGGGVYSSTSV